MKHYSLYIYVVVCVLSSCNGPDKVRQNFNASKHSVVEYPISDSNDFQHIKNEFYRRNDGRLFQRTFEQVEVENIDTLVDIEYFNQSIPQDIDPLSFEVLDGWFAKDKNFVYYYRPTSGGMQISKMADADAQTFKVLDGDYRFAVDKKHVFEEIRMLGDLTPLNLVVKRNTNGYITELSNGNVIHKIEAVEE